MGKKGISPLIATVLLIGFTVALAAVIFTWGINFTKDTTDRTTQQADIAAKCGRVSFDVKALCTDGKLDTIEVTNREDITLQAFKFSVSNDKETKVYDFNSTDDALEGFGRKPYSTDFSKIANPIKIEARAGIKTDNTVTFCAAYVREAKVECQ